MLSVVIREHERGLLFHKGRLEAWLEPGRYSWLLGAKHREVKILNLDLNYELLTPELKRVLPKGAGEELFVPTEHIAIVRRDSEPVHCLLPGRYVLWQSRAEIKADLYKLDGLFLDIPQSVWHLIPSDMMTIFSVLPYQRYALYVDGKFQQILEQGRFAVNQHRRNVFWKLLDMREQERQIIGQEVMTSDKVSLRINLLVKYRITDARMSVESVTELSDALYSEAQVVARSYIAGLSVDQLLESRNHAAMQMREMLQPRAETWGVEILRIDIKDVVLPGDMKALLNRVIEAEKEAAANVILRREETAATRSLANTAKMLDNNPTLLRLKEIEAIKEIAGNIQNLTVVAGADDLFGRLTLPATPSQNSNQS